MVRFPPEVFNVIRSDARSQARATVAYAAVRRLSTWSRHISRARVAAALRPVLHDPHMRYLPNGQPVARRLDRPSRENIAAARAAVRFESYSGRTRYHPLADLNVWLRHAWNVPMVNPYVQRPVRALRGPAVGPRGRLIRRRRNPNLIRGPR